MYKVGERKGGHYWFAYRRPKATRGSAINPNRESGSASECMAHSPALQLPYSRIIRIQDTEDSGDRRLAGPRSSSARVCICAFACSRPSQRSSQMISCAIYSRDDLITMPRVPAHLSTCCPNRNLIDVALHHNATRTSRSGLVLACQLG